MPVEVEVEDLGSEGRKQCVSEIGILFVQDNTYYLHVTREMHSTVHMLSAISPYRW